MTQYGVNNAPRVYCARHHVFHPATERCPDCRAIEVGEALAGLDEVLAGLPGRPPVKPTNTSYLSTDPQPGDWTAYTWI